ncbi:MAG: glycosylhydrolase-like jelly roll fold domain-containing protein, partial [Blastocatellia bacterium]
EILRAPPDFALAGATQSDGLTFIHKQAGDVEVYFVANLQPAPSETAVTFRVSGKRPERWDAMTGEITRIVHYRAQKDGIEIPLRLAPWESTFVIFSPGASEAHIVKTDLAEVRTAGDGVFTGIAASNGRFAAEIREGQGARSFSVKVTDLPEPLPVAGRWKLTLEGVRFPRIEKEITQLASWTESADTRYLSGSGLYEIEFDLPAEYLRKETELLLDLGAVGDVAEVKLNDQAVGVRWMQPYRFDVTRTARAGKNRLQVIITNALHNHVAGMKEPPGLPAELAGRYGGQARKYVLGEAVFKARDQRLQTLPVSGLLGPVRIVAWRVALIGRLRK